MNGTPNRPKRHLAPIAIAIACLLAATMPARAQAPDNFAMGDILGPGSSLKVAKDGSIRWTMDAEGQMSEMIARKTVVVRSPKFNLDCDTLTYNAKTNRIMAFGNPVTVSQNEIDATSREFRYDIDEGKIILEGDPVIRQKTRGPDGKLKPGPRVSGGKITIIQKKDGSTEMIVDPGRSGAEIKGGDTASGAAPDNAAPKATPTRKPAMMEVNMNDLNKTEKPPEKTEKPGPVKIDPKSPEKIPEPALDEGGA